MIYTLIGSMAYSGLMVCISNSPFLVMEKGGFSVTQYSFIFGANAMGMMIGIYAVNYLMKLWNLRQIVKYVSIIQIFIGLMSVVAVWSSQSVNNMLLLIFLYLLPTGVLFPTTTDLALESFHEESGTASAVFGFSRLTVTFIVSSVSGLIQGDSGCTNGYGLIFLCLGICGVFKL